MMPTPTAHDEYTLGANVRSIRYEPECRPCEEERHYHHERCEPYPPYVPSLCDLALAKYMELYTVGVRFVEAAMLKPLLFERALLASTTPRHPWPEPCAPHVCHRCGRPEHECRCEHPREEARPCGTADIRVSARETDVVHKVLLVENNGPRPVTVNIVAEPWNDATGKQSAATITFTPATLTLAPCEAHETIAQISVPATGDLRASYFTRVHFQGSCARPISIELCVEPQNRIDHYSQTDPCRPRCGRFVDVAYEHHCGDPHCRHCGPRRCEPMDPCGPRRDPWQWYADPWRWRGPDPYRFWYGIPRWDRILLPAVVGGRCC